MKFLILSIAAAAVMVINTMPVGAWSYPGTGNMGVAIFTQALPGDPVTSVDARTLGLSGASLASSNGVNGIFYNPANLALGSMKAISLGLYSNHSSEMNLEEKEYTSSTLYKGPVFGVRIPLSGLRLGFGYRESFDMGYYHEHKEFTEGNADTFKTDISGGQKEIIIAAAFRLLGGLHTGFSYNIVGGGIEGASKEIYYETSRKEKDIERSLSGGFMELGLLYKIDRDLAQVGFSWSPEYIIEDKWSSDSEQYTWDSIADDWDTLTETSLEGSRDVKMPSTMGLGIQYNFLGLDRTMITADV
ncbi:MAG: hypothetical protein U9R36_06270, partial [Elusimicrobiota bacterium]|nr:hypothetical protein [Elusimicrobiota bacterium]